MDDLTTAEQALARFDQTMRHLPHEAQQIRNGRLTSSEVVKIQTGINAWNRYLELNGGVIPANEGGIAHYPG